MRDSGGELAAVDAFDLSPAGRPTVGVPYMSSYARSLVIHSIFHFLLTVPVFWDFVFVKVYYLSIFMSVFVVSLQYCVVLSCYVSFLCSKCVVPVTCFSFRVFFFMSRSLFKEHRGSLLRKIVFDLRACNFCACLCFYGVLLC